MATRIIEWDGKELPAELRDLPPGRYVVEPLDEALILLTPAEEEGILAAMDDLDAGRGIPLGQALEEMRARSSTGRALPL